METKHWIGMTGSTVCQVVAGVFSFLWLWNDGGKHQKLLMIGFFLSAAACLLLLLAPHEKSWEHFTQIGIGVGLNLYWAYECKSL